MEIKKTVITKVQIDKDRELCVGDTVKFIANDIAYFGEFDGLTNRGFLQFSALIGGTLVIYAVSHKSIKAIEVIEHGINK